MLLSDDQWTVNGTCCCHHPAGVAVGPCPDGDITAAAVTLGLASLRKQLALAAPFVVQSVFPKPVSGSDYSALLGTGADWSSHSAFVL